MPEMLARMPREPTLSAPAPEISARRVKSTAAALKGKRFRILPRSPGGYVALLFAASLIGVIVNAVGLQHERHPAPLFRGEPAPAPSPLAAPAPPVAAPSEPPVMTSPDPASRLDAAPTPVPRPQEFTPPISSATKKGDPINDLLRGVSPPDNSKEVVAAQKSLKKLGYDIEPDGVMGADTERALHEFERSHNLPLSSDLTPRLLARLAATAH